ncbi:MAG: methyltransferase domain-containing protein, partial [Acidimicrobiales bacterium]|nr:methyltransferase domain-containing protein [Acidimicrobiales bacterium]
RDGFVLHCAIIADERTCRRRRRTFVDGYEASTYGDRFADVYDDWYQDVSDVGSTVDRIAALAGPRGGRVLELGAGSGRLAIPLAERGLEVWAVDASTAMIDRLRAKPGGDRVHAVVDDMAGLAAPGLGDGGFGVVLCAFNTLFNITDTEGQRRCLARARDLLAPDGLVVIETFVPPPGGERDAAVGAVEPRHIGLDEVVLTVSRLDPATRTITGQHVQITEGGVRLRPWVLHYASPAELDALAAEAGLRLVERHAGWHGEAFTATAETHVTLYGTAR